MKKVIIIGAGPAGLTAAYELLKQSKEYEVTVLEADDRVGGISKTVRYHGNRMDIGGHRFFSKEDSVVDWWLQMLPLQGKPSYDDKKLGLKKDFAEKGPDPEKEDRTMLLRRRVSRIYYKKKFFDYPISMKLQTIMNLGLLQTCKAGFSYLLSCLHKLPETSLENFYINRFGRVLYSMFFEGYTLKLWGRHPREIAADWGSQRVKGLSIIEILKNMLGKVFKASSDHVETSLIEEFMYPKYGPGQLWETAAAEFEKLGGKLQLSAEVVGVTMADAKHVKSVTVQHADGSKEELPADIVISSMPLKDLSAAMGKAMPAEAKAVAEGLPYRDFVTLGVLVNHVNLKNETELKTLNNIIPDCWIYVQDAGVKLGRIQVFNNWSPYLVQDVEDKLWIGLEYFCAEGDDFWNMPAEECLSFAAKELVKMGVINSEKDILDFHREKVKKAYPAYFDTYGQIDTLVEYLDTIDNLYCIGRNGQHRYNNMDHSMVTAFEAVKNIISGQRDRSNIWNVNVEQEYHEKK